MNCWAIVPEPPHYIYEHTCTRRAAESLQSNLGPLPVCRQHKTTIYRKGAWLQMAHGREWITTGNLARKEAMP